MTSVTNTSKASISPYFDSPRRSRRKATATVVVTVLASACARAVEGCFVSAPTTTPALAMTIRAAKRKTTTTSVTPSSNKRQATRSTTRHALSVTPKHQHAVNSSASITSPNSIPKQPRATKEAEHTSNNTQDEVKETRASIVDHQLNSDRRTYSVKVQWNTGEETWEPLSKMARDEPETSTLYAKDKGLLETPGWKRFQRMSNVAKASKQKEVVKAAILRNIAPGATQSFEPLSSKQFLKDRTTLVPVHTIILGTHPSIRSLAKQQYYGHPMNAFWWIAGDCLGFRRDSAISKTTGKPYRFSSHLRYGQEDIISYPKQMEKLTLSGFALWDVVKTCQRKGSLDQDIRNEQPNQVREFCEKHRGTLRRIVFANGKSTCDMFRKHFRDWLESGELQYLHGHDASERAFARAIARGDLGDTNPNKITLIAALSVSPAAALYPYQEKRDFWDEHVYGPGLGDFQFSQQQHQEQQDY